MRTVSYLVMVLATGCATPFQGARETADDEVVSDCISTVEVCADCVATIDFSAGIPDDGEVTALTLSTSAADAVVAVCGDALTQAMITSSATPTPEGATVAVEVGAEGGALLVTLTSGAGETRFVLEPVQGGPAAVVAP